MGEEAAGVGEGEADVRDGEGGEVGRAGGEEFELCGWGVRFRWLGFWWWRGLGKKGWNGMEWNGMEWNGMEWGTHGPATEEDALVPGTGRGGGDLLDGVGDEAHYGVGVVVELFGGWLDGEVFSE